MLSTDKFYKMYRMFLHEWFIVFEYIIDCAYSVPMSLCPKRLSYKWMRGDLSFLFPAHTTLFSQFDFSGAHWGFLLANLFFYCYAWFHHISCNAAVQPGIQLLFNSLFSCILSICVCDMKTITQFHGISKAIHQISPTSCHHISIHYLLMKDNSHLDLSPSLQWCRLKEFSHGDRHSP